MAKKHLLTTINIASGRKAAKITGEKTRLNDGGGLSLVILPTEVVYWIFRYMLKGKSAEIYLGKYPDLTLANARSKAEAIRNQLANGLDPKAEKERQAKELAQQEEATRQQAAIDAARSDFAGLFARWIKQSLQTRKDKGLAVVDLWRKYVLPKLGDIPADEVKKAHLADILQAVQDAGYNRTTEMLLAQFKQFYTFAVSRDLLEQNPSASLQRRHFTKTKPPRDRILSNNEISALFRALPNSGLIPRSRLAMIIALATACRIGELLKAKCADVDLNTAIWTIPAENAKNGKAHKIHLSLFAIQAFNELLSYHNGAEWLYSSTHDHSVAVCPKTVTRQVRDRQTPPEKCKYPYQSNALALEGGHWTPHDLRRTAATLMGELGVQPHIIERCLNHVEENKIIKTYQRQEYLNERKAAFDVLGKHLDNIASGRSNVTVMPLRQA